jgi:hypothetical protein
MKRIDIPVPPTADVTDLDLAIERAALTAGLRPSLRGGLTQYPGATHWHFKRDAEPGTLEITWWPRQMQLWLTVHDNRDAPWITAASDLIISTLDERLRKTN